MGAQEVLDLHESGQHVRIRLLAGHLTKPSCARTHDKVMPGELGKAGAACPAQVQTAFRSLCCCPVWPPTDYANQSQLAPPTHLLFVLISEAVCKNGRFGNVCLHCVLYVQNPLQERLGVPYITRTPTTDQDRFTRDCQHNTGCNNVM